MRRARRSSLIALLLMMALTGPEVESALAAGVEPATDAGALGSGTRASTDPDSADAPDASPSDPAATARREVEDAEHVRQLRIDDLRLAEEYVGRARTDEKRLSEEQSAAFERIRAVDASMNEMTRHLEDLDRRRAETQARIETLARSINQLVPVLHQMSEQPVETLRATGLPVDDAIRGLMVVRGLARQADADARTLIAERERLDAATQAATDSAARLSSAKVDRMRDADLASGKLAFARTLRQSAERDAVEAARLFAAEAARADLVHGVVRTLETQRDLEAARMRENLLRTERDQRSADAGRSRQTAGLAVGSGTSAADSRPAGQGALPAVGVLVRAWGDVEEGEPAAGQSWRTAPGAPVSAPCAGVVAFAGPFRGYGLLIVIDCGGGFHAVLGGLDNLAVSSRRRVRLGEPLGSMPGYGATAIPVDSSRAILSDDYSALNRAPDDRPPGDAAARDVAARDAMMLASAGAASGVLSRPPPGAQPVESAILAPAAEGVTEPILYFELRKDGRPVNPEPWMASRAQ